MMLKKFLFNLFSNIKSWVKANRFSLAIYSIQFFFLLWFLGSIGSYLYYLAVKTSVKAIAGKKLKTWWPGNRKKWWDFRRPYLKPRSFIPKEGNLSTPTVETLKLITTTDKKLESIRKAYKAITLEDLKNIEVTFEETQSGSQGPWVPGYQDPVTAATAKWRKGSQPSCSDLLSESDFVPYIDLDSGPYNPSNFLLTGDPLTSMLNVSDLHITMKYLSDIQNIPQELPYYSDLVRNYYTLKELPFYPTDETAGNINILEEIYMDLMPTGDMSLPRGLYSELDDPNDFGAAANLPLDLDFSEDLYAPEQYFLDDLDFDKDLDVPEQYFLDDLDLDLDTPKDFGAYFSDDIFSLLLETWV